MPLGKEVGLDPGHIVLDGDPVGTQSPTAAPAHFSAHVYCGQTVAHLSNSWALVNLGHQHISGTGMTLILNGTQQEWP